MYQNKILKCIAAFVLLWLINISSGVAQNKAVKFKAIAFYTAKDDQAHISFVHEANKWFPKIAAEYNFSYDSTSDWNNLNAKFLSQ